MLPPLPNTTEFPLQLYYSVLTSNLNAPLVILVLAHVSCILHWSLSPFLELHCTIPMDLLLTWTTFSDHFWVPYHYIYTLILPFFTARGSLPSPCTSVFTVVFVVWLFRPYRHCSHIITMGHGWWTQENWVGPWWQWDRMCFQCYLCLCTLMIPIK